MYCQKLSNILHDPKSNQLGIDASVTTKLDHFLKQKTTLKERQAVNPVKFSMVMHVNDRTSLAVFLLGVSHKLFSTRYFYSCVCGEQLELSSLEEPTICECRRTIIPSKARERVFLFFNLLERPEPCEEEIATSQTQLDFVREFEGGESFFSLADAQRCLGDELVEESLSLSDLRTARFRQQLNGGNVVT